jgi:hypothetical protein
VISWRDGKHKSSYLEETGKENRYLFEQFELSANFRFDVTHASRSIGVFGVNCYQKKKKDADVMEGVMKGCKKEW